MAQGIVRRKDRQISPEESRAILERGDYGVLGTVDADGHPYVTPLSYIVMNDEIFFHSAREGHKITNLAADNRVSFVVVDRTETAYNGHFTAYYESVTVFGRAREVTDADEKYSALYALIKKYTPERLDKAADYIARHIKPTAVYAISLETVTGKANREKRESSD